MKEGLRSGDFLRGLKKVLRRLEKGLRIAEEGTMIGILIEPGFEPVIIIIIVDIAIIVILIVMIFIIIIIISSCSSSSSLEFRVGRACVPGFEKTSGGSRGRRPPRGGVRGGGAPPICKW